MKFHVFWPTTVQAVALFASTGLSIWAAVIARTRRGVPGGNGVRLDDARGRMVELHQRDAHADRRLRHARLHFEVPVSRRRADRRAVAALHDGIQPHRVAGSCDSLECWCGSCRSSTLVLVATNEQHRLHWAVIEEVMTPLGRRLIYRGGTWYWVHASLQLLPRVARHRHARERTAPLPAPISPANRA